MSEHGNRNRNKNKNKKLELGTKLKTAILRSVSVIPEFERGTKFRESRESV